MQLKIRCYIFLVNKGLFRNLFRPDMVKENARPQETCVQKKKKKNR